MSIWGSNFKKVDDVTVTKWIFQDCASTFFFKVFHLNFSLKKGFWTFLIKIRSKMFSIWHDRQFYLRTRPLFTKSKICGALDYPKIKHILGPLVQTECITPIWSNSCSIFFSLYQKWPHLETTLTIFFRNWTNVSTLEYHQFESQSNWIENAYGNAI